jgi:hypothetical protein
MKSWATSVKPDNIFAPTRPTYRQAPAITSDPVDEPQPDSNFPVSPRPAAAGHRARRRPHRRAQRAHGSGHGFEPFHASSAGRIHFLLAGAGRTQLIDAAIIDPRKFLLHAQFYESEAAPVRLSILRSGNGILRAETGGRIEARNAGKRSEFGSQTAIGLANQQGLRGFVSPWKPRRFAGNAWWAMQGSNLRPLPCEVCALAYQRGAELFICH